MVRREEIKNAAPDDANTESGTKKENSKDTENAILTTNININAGVLQVENFLRKGEENALTTKELLKVSGLPNARVLQATIERERSAGALILSTVRNGGGYFLPDDGEKGLHELVTFVRTLRSRALNTLRVLKPARQAIKRIDGQLEIVEGRECGEK